MCPVTCQERLWGVVGHGQRQTFACNLQGAVSAPPPSSLTHLGWVSMAFSNGYERVDSGACDGVVGRRLQRMIRFF